MLCLTKVLFLILSDTTCSSNMFTCKVSGRCIPMTWTCDSDLDCGDNDDSDEHEKCGECTIFIII